MEHHRLKPMGNYPVELFETLYKQTAGLRRKLASQIDPRKFGVDYQEILSWFDVKFIFIFSKYWETQPQKLLGYIISGLSTYKKRIVINSYNHKWKDYANKQDIDDMWDNPLKDDDDHSAERREFYMEKIDSFMKKYLSDDAYFLFNIQLVPPPYITEKMRQMGLKPHQNIPVNLIVDFLELEDSTASASYINGLILEIKNAKHKCTAHFKSNPILYSQSQN